MANDYSESLACEICGRGESHAGTRCDWCWTRVARPLFQQLWHKKVSYTSLLINYGRKTLLICCQEHTLAFRYKWWGPGGAEESMERACGNSRRNSARSDGEYTISDVKEISCVQPCKLWLILGFQIVYETGILDATIWTEGTGANCNPTENLDTWMHCTWWIEMGDTEKWPRISY